MPCKRMHTHRHSLTPQLCRRILVPRSEEQKSYATAPKRHNHLAIAHPFRRTNSCPTAQQLELLLVISYTPDAATATSFARTAY